MKEKGVDLINMYEMKNTQRPLFLVITGKYETLNSISKKCPALSHIRVSFHRDIGQEIMKSAKTPHQNVRTAEAGPHTANNLNCPVYQKWVQYINERVAHEDDKAGRKPTRYIPAPAPKTNAWTRAPTMQPQPVSPTAASHWPALSQRYPHQQQEPPRAPQPQEPPKPQRTMTTAETLAQLSQACKRLDQLVDLSKMLKAVVDLTTLLEGCSYPTSKFMTVFEFTQNLHTYGF
ncbi:hypothetical protein TcasGA2_TC006970 [Tribolium castaneum]|uniref:Uncharacterized protein n=1 Tax=Tribolium castaneum TaxID=7070 RepID=D7GY01_TRICA|nr:hypothetical protein TcasGA2_TC006970 [Tribolium castaneum]